jgi:myosin-light-chain kinase
MMVTHAVLASLFFGRGRFGQVHRCKEKATGLKLAAKIIKARSTKDKVKATRSRSLPPDQFLPTHMVFPSAQEEVKNEINIMNQLDHVNLIQLYDAFESRNDIVLIME